MQTGIAMDVKLIHYWTDKSSFSTEFAVAKANLVSAFPGTPIIDNVAALKKGDSIGQSIKIREFRDAFPGNTLHICDVSILSSQAPRFLAVIYKDQIFIGPDNGCLYLGLDGNDLSFYLIPNQTFEGYSVRDIYIPNLIKLKNANWDISQTFTPNLTRKQFEEYNPGLPFVIRGQNFIIDRISNQINDVPEGELIAYFPWGGYLCIAQNAGNAAKNLGLYLDCLLLLQLKQPI
jgi:S-adenosylmethionine hydrolase